MYIYFNNEGKLTTQINHGEVARQGGTLHLYIAFSEDYNLAEKIVDIRFKKPGEDYFSNTNYFPDSQVPELKVFEKVKNNEITYDLVDGETYQVYTWTADSTVGLTDKNGNVDIVVRLLENNNTENIVTMGVIKLYVEKTYGEKKNKITINETEYNHLVNIVGQTDKKIDLSINRIEKLETHYITNLSELNSYTEPGIYRFNYNNANVFDLYVTRTYQIRSSSNGYYRRSYNSNNGFGEWIFNEYNVNGSTQWNSEIQYSKGDIVRNNAVYVCITNNKGYDPEEDDENNPLYWIKFEPENYILKEEGKGLSSNDYTNAEKNKLASLENYDDTELKNELNKKVAEDNLKTINGESIVGDGDIKVKGADVDLSNYYNIPTANALLERKEDKSNLKALAYKDSLSKSDIGLGNVRNVESYSKTETDEKITDVVKVAEGKTNSYVLKWFNNPSFESNEDVIQINLKDNPILDSSGAAVPNTALKIGDIFYIIETNVPDRWLAGINRDVYMFAKMETSKVNLDEYYNKTEISDLVNEYDSQLKTDIAESYYNKTEIDSKNNFVFIYLGNIGVVTSSGKLTDEQYEIVNTTEKCSILYFQTNNDKNYRYFIRGTFYDMNPDSMVFYPLSRSSYEDRYIEVDSFKTWKFRDLDNVFKINNKTGVVTLTANDVGAYSKTETDALLPKTIDLGLVEDENSYPLPEGKTINDFTNADIVNITTPINNGEEVINVSVELHKSGNVQGMAAVFYAIGISMSFQLNVSPEGYVLIARALPTNWWVEEFSSYQNRIFYRAYEGGKSNTYEVYGNKIKLNGTTYEPFNFTEPETLDIDTVIDNKIAAAIDNTLNTKLAKINKVIEEDY